MMTASITGEEGIAARIKAQRERMGLKQQELADQLNVERPTYTRWENGVIAVRASDLKRLSQILSVRVSYFYGEEISDGEFSPDDAETRRIFIRFGKGGHEGYVTPPPEFWPVIRAYLKQRPGYPGDILLAYSQTQALGEHGVGRIFENVVKVAGLEGQGITPHCLRHAFAMRGIENGADLKTVQAQMRHVHPATTMRYLVTNRPVSDDKAAAFGRAVNSPPPTIPVPPANTAPPEADAVRQRRRIAVLRRV